MDNSPEKQQTKNGNSIIPYSPRAPAGWTTQSQIIVVRCQDTDPTNLSKHNSSNVENVWFSAVAAAVLTGIYAFGIFALISTLPAHNSPPQKLRRTRHKSHTLEIQLCEQKRRGKEDEKKKTNNMIIKCGFDLLKN